MKTQKYLDIIARKNLYFAISLIAIIPGLIALLLWGLRPSIDFVGGTRLEYSVSDIKNKVSSDDLKKTVEGSKVEVGSVQQSGNSSFIVRTKQIDQKEHRQISVNLQTKYPGIKEVSYETIGPTVSSEITFNAIKAVVFASLFIVLYIAWSFRKVPPPVTSWRFGICAIAALLHDVLFVVGVFAILGHFWHVEVDSLFVTAILTVIGFSVHDTIVVFDRIRENLRRMQGMAFATVVNESILQTIGRSLNTSLTVLLVLFALLLFGGESTRWFIVALLIGITSGTYSSIFNAAPLLVLWEEIQSKRAKN